MGRGCGIAIGAPLTGWPLYITFGWMDVRGALFKARGALFKAGGAVMTVLEFIRFMNTPPASEVFGNTLGNTLGPLPMETMTGWMG